MKNDNSRLISVLIIVGILSVCAVIGFYMVTETLKVLNQEKAICKENQGEFTGGELCLIDNQIYKFYITDNGVKLGR